MVHETPLGVTRQIDASLMLLFGEILELAASQDGTMDTANRSLFAIEDAVLATLSGSCRHITATVNEEGNTVCLDCRRPLDDE